MKYNYIRVNQNVQKNLCDVVFYHKYDEIIIAWRQRWENFEIWYEAMVVKDENGICLLNNYLSMFSGKK